MTHCQNQSSVLLDKQPLTVISLYWMIHHVFWLLNYGVYQPFTNPFASFASPFHQPFTHGPNELTGLKLRDHPQQQKILGKQVTFCILLSISLKQNACAWSAHSKHAHAHRYIYIYNYIYIYVHTHISLYNSIYIYVHVCVIFKLPLTTIISSRFSHDIHMKGRHVSTVCSVWLEDHAMVNSQL